MPKIAKVELPPLAVPGPGGDGCDSACDTLVVRVTDENGLTGIGECDAPPLVAKSFLEMPLPEGPGLGIGLDDEFVQRHLVRA